MNTKFTLIVAIFVSFTYARCQDAHDSQSNIEIKADRYKFSVLVLREEFEFYNLDSIVSSVSHFEYKKVKVPYCYLLTCDKNNQITLTKGANWKDVLRDISFNELSGVLKFDSIKVAVYDINQSSDESVFFCNTEDSEYLFSFQLKDYGQSVIIPAEQEIWRIRLK